MASNRNPTLAASKIALLYALLSVLWILFSDQLLSMTAATVEALTMMQMVKGWMFVLTTSVLIFFLMRQEMRRVLRAHEARQASEANFKLLVESAPDAIYVQTGGRIAYLNRAALKLFKAVSDDQLLGRSMLEMIAPPYRSLVEERMRVLNDEKKAVPIRAHVYKRMDGTPVDVEVNAVPFNYKGQDGALVFVRDITERKQAEDALQHQFGYLQQLINAIPAPVFFKDIGGAYTGCNAAFEEFKGLRREDIIGKTPFDISPPHLAHLYLDKDRELYSQAKPQIYEGQSVNADGETRDILFHKAMLSGADGGIDGMVGVMLDITERKRTEALLRESQKHYRLVADFTYDWEYWLDPSGAFQYVSPSCERVSGYPPSFFLNDPQALLHIVHPEDRERFISHTTTSNRTDHGPCESEFRIIRKDGSLRWINHVCTSVYTDDGTFIGRRGSNRDITDQRLAQEAVRETEARFRTAFENAAVGMALVDSGGVYLETNAAMAAMIGYATSELVGRKVADFTHPEDLERRGRFIDDLLEGKLTSGEHERRFIHRDGSIVYTLLWATVQRDEKGRFQYFISLIQNITKRVLAQQDKERLETQLQQAQKMESLGTLAGGIAHDFNNILGVIIGSSELLAVTDAVEESARGSLSNILSAAQRARDLVRQILAFSRHAQQEKILLNFKALIKEAFEFLRASLPTTIQLHQQIEPRVGMIMADPTQMQQILLNLCTNAAHAMEKTGGALHVRLSNATLTEADVRFDSGLEPGEFVKLEVTDTGHGIDPGIINRIFDPYFTTKEKGKGTGLGLAVVHGIVKAHGGTIKVSSEIGQGTSIQVFLPAMEGQVRPERRIAPDLPRGNERVLLVDDEKVLADIEKRMLNMLGYQVEIRTSPVEALEAFRANSRRFDLVITDMTMPQLTGLNLARKILEIRPGVPIILCTGFSEQASEQTVLTIGIRKLLLKPLAMESLALAVREALDCSPPAI